MILEIFGERANTHEGKLQVELAHLLYQKSRLVKTWTHLERQRGGFGFLGGPGETQLELDKRMLSQRIKKIQSLLKKVKNTFNWKAKVNLEDGLKETINLTIDWYLSYLDKKNMSKFCSDSAKKAKS